MANRAPLTPMQRIEQAVEKFRAEHPELNDTLDGRLVRYRRDDGGLMCNDDILGVLRDLSKKRPKPSGGGRHNPRR